MKEECKLCSVNGWGGAAQGMTDFSISSLMRPAASHAGPEPRHDAVLLSAYLFKLGDYPLYTLHDHYATSGEYRAPYRSSHLLINTRTTNKRVDTSPPTINSPSAMH
uniref:SFRICE_037516 n=1 Tax=Spodoptera frugiperda TaxID=7108 RepID=A0A2H1WZJ7_SPOFR